ncbi:permease [Snodgrassella alvi]|uniref:permease n=1 Tax=Snodgrassella alvi TaxID=1196083 RepID=UPI0009FD047F|nr:permease [Snodgrassella alvi]ORF04908.1 permease [Snodgrassella alvi]
MTLFLPLIYLLCGLIAGKLTRDTKPVLSLLLTKFIIPVVIIYNIATNFSNMGAVLITTIVVMSIMLLAGKFLRINPVSTLCFSYLNIGWLGLPVAASLFGNQAAAIFISAYIGSSIVGNSLGAWLLTGIRFNIRKLIQMPPVIALIIGCLLLPLGKQIRELDIIYSLAKFLMSFLGMAILGMWLAKSRITLTDIRNTIQTFLKKAAAYFCILSALLGLACLCRQNLILENSAALYLFCLLPPAANIIVLETHYLGTGYSVKPISCGTCISIIAIGIYAIGIIAIKLTN